MENVIIGPMPLQGSQSLVRIEDSLTAAERAKRIRIQRAEDRRIAKLRKLQKKSKRTRAEYGKLQVLSTIRTVRGDNNSDEIITKLSLDISDTRKAMAEASDEQLDKLAGQLLKFKAQLSIAEKAKEDKSGDAAILALADAEVTVIRMARALCTKALKDKKLMEDLLVFLEDHSGTFGTVTKVSSKVR